MPFVLPLVAMLLCNASHQASADVWKTIFYDDFESGWAWESGDDDSTNGLDYWGRLSGFGHSGTHCAHCAFYRDGQPSGMPGYDNYMQSYMRRVFDLSQCEDAKLNFWYYQDHAADDYLEVNGITCWDGGGTGWTWVNVNLDEFVGDPTVIVEFWFENDDDVVSGAGFYVDDIVMEIKPQGFAFQPLSLELAGCYITPTTASPGDTVTFHYRIYNPNPVPIGVGLGASIAPAGTGMWRDDEAHDWYVTCPAGPATSDHTRPFYIDPDEQVYGLYDGAWGLVERFGGEGWDYQPLPDQLTLQGGNVAPELELLGPSDLTISPGESVIISWTDDDPDDNAYISLAYDNDCDPHNGGNIWITSGLLEDDESDYYEWNTAGLPPGVYRVWGMIHDGHNDAVYSCAPGSITILPTVQLNVPYYSQGNCAWCWAASTAMLIEYYQGYDRKPWEIAADFGYSCDSGLDANNVHTYLETWYNFDYEDAWAFYYDIATRQEIISHLNGAVQAGHPVFVGSNETEHAVVVVGFDPIDVVYHNPSLGHPCQRESWDSFLNDLLGRGQVQLIYANEALPVDPFVASVFANPGFDNLYFWHFHGDEFQSLGLLWDGRPEQGHNGYAYERGQGTQHPEDPNFGFCAVSADVLNLNPYLVNGGQAGHDLTMLVDVYRKGNGWELFAQYASADSVSLTECAHDPRAALLQGYSLEDLDTGTYKLDVALFDEAGQQHDAFSIEFCLERVYGTITVDVDPQEAQWLLTGPGGYELTHEGDYGPAEVPVGDYTLTWQSRIGWVTPTPNPDIGTLLVDQELPFSGTYLPLDAPSNVTATDGTVCDQIGISWTAVAYADFYTVLRGVTDQPAEATEIITTPEVTYGDQNVIAGATYYYWVRANAGDDQSSLSAPDDGSARSTPVAPISVAASDRTACWQVEVSWDEVPGAESYEIYRNINSSPPATPYDTADTNSYEDNVVPVGPDYWYWIKACNTCGCSDYSEPAVGRPNSPPGDAPSCVAPNNGATCVPESTCLEWSQVDGADSYNVYWGTSDPPALWLDGHTDPFACPPNSVGETYYWRVEACNECEPCSESAAFSYAAGRTPASPDNAAADPPVICAGECSTLTASVAGAVIDWHEGACDGPVVGSGNSVQLCPTQTTTYYARARDAASDCASDSCDSVLVTVEAPVTLTTHPTDLSVCAGDTAEFTVAATGDGTLHYQWLMDGDAVGDDAPQLTFTAEVDDDLVEITCEVSNDCGAAASNPALLRVCPSCAGGDCNDNGIADDCDIFVGASEDCNGNENPDECELADYDCDENGVIDICETDPNVLYVDKAYAGCENGTSDHPFNTVREAHDAATAGDLILIYAGHYQEALILNKPIRLESQGGLVRIGQ